MTFEQLHLEPRLLEGLEATGFNKATPIQEQAIPLILEGHDIIASAQTGTGKTAAYLLPIIHKILEEGQGQINTLIIAPTRELAQQIDQQIEGLGYFTSVSSAPVYGGGDGKGWDTQKNAMLRGSDIITATPGRLISLLNTGTFKFDKLKHLVLDEADRMLDMGFFDDILRIIEYLPKQRQTLLFSATMPPKIRILANRILKEPKEINIAISKPAEGILQQAYLAYDSQKEELVRRILQDEKFASVIIFASTKEKVKKLDVSLRKSGFSVKAFHSDLEQIEREEILRSFKSRKLRILVGTDVISRGIDVENINLVINFDTPSDPEDYIHRIGRTARASSVGTAITLINDKDQQKFQNIENLIGREVPKMPLPPELGKGPDYEPGRKPAPSFKKKSWKKPFRSGGK
jgi:ATP-dependent RNA helicase RhlE